MKYVRDHIDQIMDCFDFMKVHDTMVALNWTWYTCNGVPEEWQIRREARLLLMRAYDSAYDTKQTSYCGTGGLQAEASYRDGKYEGLSLKFVLTEWDTFDN